MIASLSGKLISKTPQSALVDVHGVGCEAFVSLNTFYTLPEPGEAVALHTYLHVREDVLSLYGFGNPREKAVFLLLLGVSGIGPKLALNILSGMPPDDLIRAVGAGDAARLATIPGVGKKTAERMALELRERILSVTESPVPAEAGVPGPSEGSVTEDIVSALVNLGYKRPQAKEAVRKVINENNGDVPIETMIKEALKLLSR